jgi:Ca-activated chloride channel family protein
MKRFVALLALAVSPLWGDAGILIPSNNSEPDPKILSLEEMEIDVRIDNGVARVSMQQIFASHSSSVLEGNWIFALPESATISDFAVWDGVTRIPGVILERKRAEELYESIKAQSIDPGLLQQGEYGADEARRSAVFSAKVVPIPGHGFKRVEVEYHERIAVENLRSRFAIPLRPDAYRAQQAGRLRVNLTLASEHAIRDFRVVGDTYAATTGPRAANRVELTFEGNDVLFDEDFAVEWALDDAASDSLEVLTYRDPSTRTPSPDTVSPEPAEPVAGFFQASALLSSSQPATVDATAAGLSKQIIVLFDNSLSMQWEKLDRAYLALETVLHGLRPNDRFNLVLFNNEISTWQPKPASAGAENVEGALGFIRGSYIRGGTDFQGALETGVAQAAGGEAAERYLLLITDGGSTRGMINNARLAEWYNEQLSRLGDSARPRVFAFAVGDDANLGLLRLLTKGEGVLEWVRSTEPADFKLNAFQSKIGRDPVGNLSLRVEPASAFDMIYPLQTAVFDGSVASWVGQYSTPASEAVLSVSGDRDGQAIQMEARVTLPEVETAHEHLPRTWARARVNALLEQIEREGEDRDTIDEIIRLAKKYKFVTPYTSFLAAPRSLLRPRVIRPGDPILRVRTDESINSVTALFPFGLVKKLKYLGSEDIWQTRFLAPTDMPDGKHSVRLILRDRAGRVYRESKSFLIASKPPVVRAKFDKTQFRRGETVELRVSASQSTRTLTARMYGVPAVDLRWNAEAGYNTGRFVVPENLPAGSYPLKLVAEDFAHNIGYEEVRIDVLP